MSTTNSQNVNLKVKLVKCDPVCCVCTPIFNLYKFCKNKKKKEHYGEICVTLHVFLFVSICTLSTLPV